MTLLDRYFGTRTLSALVKTLVALVALFILLDLLTHRRAEIVRNEIPLNIVVLYYALYAPRVIYQYQAGALAVLVSTLLVLGNAAQHNEIVAALAGGVSLRRIVRAPVVLAAAAAVAVFAMQETLGVAASRQFDRLERQYFPQSAERRRPGVSWAELDGGWTCHVMKFNRAALTGEGVLLHAERDGAFEQIYARRIFWDEDQGAWFLEDGRWFVFHPEKEWEEEVFRITQQRAPIRETPDQLFALDARPDTRSAAALAAQIREARRHGIPVQRHAVDLHAKFAQPVLCFVAVWLAIPFALRLRKGGLAISFGVSIALGLAYLLLFRVAIGLGHLERLWPPVAAWLANAVFMAMGAALFRRTQT